ncbi:hypothetical protein D3C78_1225200 [compost metagenome]
MHGIGAFQPFLARWGNGTQEAADISGGNAEAAQRHDHDMRKILTHAALQLEGFRWRRIHRRRLAIIGEIPVDAFAQRARDFANGHSGFQQLPGIGGYRRVHSNPRARANEMVRRLGIERPDIGKLLRQAVKLRREIRRQRRCLHHHAGLHADVEFFMRRAQMHRGRRLMKEIIEGDTFFRRRRNIDGTGDKPLPAGNGERQNADDVARAVGRCVVGVTHMQGKVVEHRIIRDRFGQEHRRDVPYRFRADDRSRRSCFQAS